MYKTNYKVIEILQRVWHKLPLSCPIIGSHIRRIGVIRVILGAVGMYLSIPVFIIVHAIVIQILLRWIIFPFLGLGHLTMEKFLILDRYKVKGLCTIDKFHCLFCGWVNGLCIFLDRQVDIISTTPKILSSFKKKMLILLCLTYTLPSLVIQVCFFIIYNYLIAAPLCLKKVYYGSLIKLYCFKEPYALKYNVWARRFLIYQKISWRALGLALEQIESSFCPIKHFERMDNAVFPDHHKLFFEPHQVDALRQFLYQYGTTLERKLK